MIQSSVKNEQIANLRVFKTISELIDLIDPERIVDFCLDHRKYQLLFDVIKPLRFKQDLDYCPKFQLIIWMFNETINRN